MFWRVVRGMIPYKTKRGAAALARLKVVEGIPAQYRHIKRAVVPAAMRVLRINPIRDVTVLGDLCSGLGWKYKNIVEEVEKKRKERDLLWFKRKQQVLRLKKVAEKIVNRKIRKTTLSDPIRLGHLKHVL
eukprot:NODE_8447_length_677_cov_127.779783_g7824_i0.p2 GENE.NODE_8447_length_677_cov_127.779783_g7824_i0~~NODE_8447_length_677_cov_127.779783_g7824_i0.p2  ORF type:complete len:130 (+),score=28.48 NODE_8447_length_677_cov_127.779783_g7824_i0:213-602(+)